MALPLADLRVLAVEQYGAGPFGTQFLADLGAEVIKVENPNDGGDYARKIGPHFFTPEHSEFFHAYNRNKKSLTLDLSREEGRRIFQELVADADAVASNLRGDVPARLGLTYDILRSVNARIVCAHLSAYGREGSRADWPGFDYLMQAEAGYLSLTGEPGSPPARFGLSVIDQMSGLALAFAIVAGVTGARTSGRGRDLDVSLFDIALSNLAYPAVWYLNDGHVTTRLERSQHPSLSPCQLYKSKDGWIFLMCNKEKFWPALCSAIGKEEWISDVRFRDFAARLVNRSSLQEKLDEVLSQRTTQEWLERFAGAVPAAPVNDIGQVLDSALVRDENRLQELEIPGFGVARVVAPPVRCGEESPSQAAPALGEHTEALLKKLGYGEPQIEGLRKDRII